MRWYVGEYMAIGVQGDQVHEGGEEKLKAMSITCSRGLSRLSANILKRKHVCFMGVPSYEHGSPVQRRALTMYSAWVLNWKQRW